MKNNKVINVIKNKNVKQNKMKKLSKNKTIKTIKNKTKNLIKNVVNSVIKNKGSGAGGHLTTKNGKNFEEITCIENVLLENNFEKIVFNKNKYGYYFEKEEENIKIIYLTQSGFKSYFSKYYNISIHRYPDEAFLIYNNNNLHIKILEKKNQNNNGSVEDKMKNGHFNKREYEKMISDKMEKEHNIKTIVSYSFCINDFLQNKFTSGNHKYNIIKEIMDEDKIKIFHGEDENYYKNILEWIYTI